MKKQTLLTFLFVSVLTLSTVAQHEIVVDFNQEKGKIKNLLGVNLGPDNQVAGYKDAGIDLIRTHDFHGAFDYEHYSDFWIFDESTQSFSTINTAFDPNNEAHYSWQETDEAMSHIYNNDMKAYFRLGISFPENENYITPPLLPPTDPNGNGFTNFAKLCKQTALHYTDGWSNGFNYDIQYWEVWNEPDGVFWRGTLMQYIEMYNEVYAALKSVNSNFKVGAPGAVPTTTIGVNTDYSDGLLSYLQNNNGKLDFYSWHLYGTKNPYGLKYWADEIRGKLDQYGFTTAESHITEINDELDGHLQFLNESARGTAYYLSHLITAQRSPIDKLFWYRGTGFFNDDVNDNASYKYSGYALKIFNLIMQETPNEIGVTGEILIDGQWQEETDNLMVLAGKSDDNNKVYIAVSNYRSDVDSYTITVKNLPWTSSDEIIYTKYTTSLSEEYEKFQFTLPGNNKMDIQTSGTQDPSVVFVTLQRNIENSIDTKYQNNSITLHPNPVKRGLVTLTNNSKTVINQIVLYNINGKKVKEIEQELSPGESSEIKLPFLSKATYIMKIKAGKQTIAKQLIIE